MKKSQSATEYSMVIGFIILLAIASIYIYDVYHKNSLDSVKASKSLNAANEIVKEVNKIYKFPDGSKSSIKVTIPNGIQTIEFEGNEIIFTYLNSRNDLVEVVKVAEIEVIGNTIINPVPGIKDLNIIKMGSSVCVKIPGEDCPLSAEQ